MWKMDEGKYTQVRVIYGDKKIYLTVSDDAPSAHPDILTDVAEKFFTYYDLNQTRVLGKPEPAPEPEPVTEPEVIPEPEPEVLERYRAFKAVSKPEPEPEPVHEPEPEVPISKIVKKHKVGMIHNKTMADGGLTILGMDCNNAIYKERVVRIFEYAKERMRDRLLDFDRRDNFTINEIIEEVFKPVYKVQSPTTIKNKASSTLRYMSKQGWIETVGKMGSNNAMKYKVVRNPFEKESSLEQEESSDSAEDESSVKYLHKVYGSAQKEK